MKEAMQTVSVLKPKTTFNYNKLQAVACIASSAAVSIGFIYWMVTALI